MPTTDQPRTLADWLREDVSDVPPLGAYAARQCVVRVQWDLLQPAAPLPPPEGLLARFSGGIDYEAEVVELLEDTIGGFVALTASDDRAAWEDATLAAMQDGAPLIVGGRLPTDEAARRVGVPDLLVRVGDAPVAGRWRYRPADIKQHAILSERDGGVPVVVCPVGAPWLDAPPDLDRLNPIGRRDRKNDLLQLAHYHRMLEACGHAAAGPAWGAILGIEGSFVWLPLDVPLWSTPSTSGTGKTAKRSALEVYDFEFAFRLDVAAAALRHAEDPAEPLRVEPVACGECGTCPWRDHCGALLDERQDVSLLPNVGFDQWALHRERGVTSMPRSSPRSTTLTARLVAAGVQLPDLIDLAADLPPATSLTDLIGRRRAQLQALADAGITTVGDLDRLDAATAAYGDTKRVWLPEHVDLARARTGPAPAYRRRGVAVVDVPRADVEVDLDMENAIDDGVYLWGVHVTDRAGTGLVDEGYRPFVTWDPAVAGAVEEQLFAQFWRWFRDLRSRVTAAGYTVTTYCWSLGAERRMLLGLGDATGVRGEVEAFLADEIVDLHDVVKDQLVTGYGMGLKDVAPLAGFAWTDGDPGGLQSLEWWRQAVTEAGPAAVRDRLLTYNRDDVLATLAVREWLARDGDRLPSIAD
jgi:predicted RecB family nuclease